MGAMKRLLFISIAATAFSQTGLPVHANRSNFYQEVRAVRDSIIAHQNAYFAQHNKYFQGLPSDTVVRDISLSLKRFNRQTQPTDQEETWEEFGLRDISVRGTYRVNVYDGPAGQGYVMTVSIAYGTDVYSLSRNVGSETWRDTNLAFVKREISPLSPER